MGTDIRVAVPGAKFGLQEVKWALFPAGASTVRLPRQMPRAKAIELLLTGDLIDAEEALRLGFINYVVPPENSWIAVWKSPARSSRTDRSQ